MRWIDMTPPEMKKYVENNAVCIVPIGSLERHGEHMPFGTDGVVAETVAVRAAEMEDCVVFPTWYYGQVHEASCFSGTVNFPPEMLIAMLRQLLSQIAANGFRKIVFVNGHGGNSNMLRFFDMATMDEERPYSLYLLDCGNDFYTDEEKTAVEAVHKTWIMGHADEDETSMIMACRPDAVKQDQIPYEEPILPVGRLNHLPGVYSAYFWYALYPENVGGTPSAGSEEEGKVLLETRVQAVARMLHKIKEDTALPAMQEEFAKRREAVSGRK